MSESGHSTELDELKSKPDPEIINGDYNQKIILNKKRKAVGFSSFLPYCPTV
jgi:hypothetical protein